MIFLFDLDGPILDVSERYYKVYTHSLRQIGGKILDKDEYWSLKRKKISDYDILHKTFSEHLLDEFRIRRNLLIEEKELLKLDSVWQELREIYQNLFNQTPAILITLRTHFERISWQLKHLGIYSWFDFILSHPASGAFEERWRAKANLINKSGILKDANPKDCVFVGDTETDILAGKNLGTRIIAVSFGIRAKESLLLLKPDLLFDTPVDLASYLQKEYL